MANIDKMAKLPKLSKKAKRQTAKYWPEWQKYLNLKKRPNGQSDENGQNCRKC